ncbi:MAG: hypothetical protein KGR26_00515 [Cyanobacteria bacterium REEB65]|nr:hypothetical protein [Cyanobacteria bacterium REEB65]
MTNPNLWAAIDFIVLIVLLVKLGGPAIAKVFTTKREAIAKVVASSEQALAEAQRALDEQRRNEAEAARLLGEVGASAKAMLAVMVADADRETEREVERAKETVKAEIERERLAMLGSVRGEILREAFAEAERTIRKALDPQRQHDLFDRFAQQAQELRL